MKKPFIPVIALTFIALAMIFFGMRTYLPAYNFTVLMVGNIVMALLSLATFYLVTAQMKSKPDAFVRGVYASSFLKLFVCIVAILTYAIVNKPNIHKPTLFVLFGIYAVYSVIETMLLSRLAKSVK
jgi:hypothetical protein